MIKDLITKKNHQNKKKTSFLARVPFHFVLELSTFGAKSFGIFVVIGEKNNEEKRSN